MLSEIEGSDDKRRMLLKLLLFICCLSQHVRDFLFLLFHLFTDLLLVITLLLFTDHIFEKVSPAMEALGMECKCLGGGKIEHNSKEKKLRVFGESTVSLPNLKRM